MSTDSLFADGTLNVVTDLAVRLDLGKIKKELRMEDRQDCSDLERLIETARPLVQPRACFKVCYVDTKGEDNVTIDGITFSSKVLRKNLDEVGRVFPFVVTIGPDLEEWARKASDILELFYLDTIANAALTEASEELQKRLSIIFGLPSLSSMSPGSLSDWPIDQQRQLFSLVDGVEQAINVRLTDQLLMMPTKSLSGILFPTEVPFVACTLCPRRRCPSRQAPFDRQTARQYSIIASAHAVSEDDEFAIGVTKNGSPVGDKK